MTTTLIRIPDDEYLFYKELASARGISLAEYFRVAAWKEAGMHKKSKTVFDLGTKVVFNGGPINGAIDHDKYYYEFEKKKRELK